MNRFVDQIRPHIESELVSARGAQAQGDYATAFSHLERAHVLGQSSTRFHVKVHWEMFIWGWQSRNLRECFGQALRIIGASTKTVWGLVPTGNTGGSNVSPFRVMPIPDDLRAILESARKA